MNPDFEGDSASPGLGVGPPPWILGHRGAPREAPENTRASLRRALALGLDGFEYDLRASADGEAVLLHDATLERTTDARGLLSERRLPELYGIDAGSWFSRRFEGEGLALFREVLEESDEHEGRPLPFHMIELKESGLVGGVARALAEMRPPPSVRVASFLRGVVLEAHDAGLPAMLLASHANEDDRRFVRDQHIEAMGVSASGWRTLAGQADWSFCERWCYSVDEPRDLIEACTSGLFGFNTNEGARALATRALVSLAGSELRRYPVEAPELIVQPESLEEETRRAGEWYGHWHPLAKITNPFAFEVQASCDLFVRSGAFRVEGLPHSVRLSPGESVGIPFELVGGSRSPGSDPLFAVSYRWWPSTEREGARLILDAPLRRLRSTSVDGMARRLTMLEEHRGERPASVTIRRRAGDLILNLEQAGELEGAHLIAVLGDEVQRGGSGLRLRLPPDFDRLALEGLAFTCGIEGRKDGRAALRRWAGGLPEGLGQGVPGRIHPLARS